jgi:hypothetical protein
MEDLGVDINNLVGKALKQIDGPCPFSLLKIIFQSGVKEDVGVNKDPTIVH